MDPHRIHYDLYEANKLLPDPGDGNTITVTKDMQLCEMIIGAGAETRTLGNPLKPGIRFAARVKTTSGGSITMTASNGLNSTPDTVATFAEEGDLLNLISVSTTTADTYRWEVMEGNTGVVLS